MNRLHTSIRDQTRRLTNRFFEWLEPSAPTRPSPNFLLTPSDEQVTSAHGSPIPREWARQTREDIPTYPPFLKGLPATVSAAQIVHTQQELIRNIYRATGVPQEIWRALYLPVIYAYAGHAHLLPASQTNHHRGAGGLFRHGLEAALYAIRQVDGREAGQTSAHMQDPSQRKREDECLRFATFCAGLLHDAGKPISDMWVLADDGVTTWNPLHEDLPQWAATQGVDRYRINWRDHRQSRHEAVSSILIPRLLGSYALGWIHEGGEHWVDMLSKALTHYETGSNKARTYATYGDQKSAVDDLKTHGESGNDIGLPLERFMINAARNMLFEGIWSVNEKGGVVWVCKAPDEGIERPFAPGTPVVALLWPRAAEAIIARLTKEDVPGVPKDPNLVARMLVDRSIAVPGRRGTENDKSIPEWSMHAPSNDKDNGMGAADTALSAALGQKVMVLADAENLLGCVPPASDYRLSSGTRTVTQTPSAGNSSATQKPTPVSPSIPPASVSPKSAPPVVRPATPPSIGHTPQPAMTAPVSEQPVEPATHASGQTNPDPSPALSVATRILQTLTRDIALERRPANIVIPAGDSAMLRYPTAFEDLGFKPFDILKILDEEGMLKPDPANPEKLAHTITLPGESKPSKVVVLTPLGIQAAPCLGINPASTTPDQIRAARVYLSSIAASCPEGRFVAEKTDRPDKGGFWFLPAEWAIHHLRAWSEHQVCPEWVLLHFDNGPALRDTEGPSIRFPSETG